MPDNVELRMTDHGGHLGFVGRGGIDPDRRWMDWRVVDWILARDRAGAGSREFSPCVAGKNRLAMNLPSRQTLGVGLATFLRVQQRLS